jgi:hypothetical protein
MNVRKSKFVTWLLLTFTLPAKRASQRVEVWRKLQRYGTVPLGNSGYLLPSTPGNEERLQWLATAIRKYGGDASVVHVKSIDNISTPQLIGRFAEARTKEYQELIRDVEKFIAMPQYEQGVGRLARMRSRFHEIVDVDFFGNPLQRRIAELLVSADARRMKPKQQAAKINHADYKSRVWVTRPRPGVDRSASAWLIRRFIDPKAEFIFAPEKQVPNGAVPFDMFYSGGFGHRGEDCTFETLQKDFRIADAKVKVIAEIIHDADLSDEKFGRSEGRGIDEVLKGWAQQGIPDPELLERGVQLMEGLYHSLSKYPKKNRGG